MVNKEALAQKLCKFSLTCLKRKALPSGHFALKNKAGPTRLGRAPATRKRYNRFKPSLFIQGGTPCFFAYANILMPDFGSKAMPISRLRSV